MSIEIVVHELPKLLWKPSESAKFSLWTLMDPIEDILGVQAYAAALQDHLAKFVLSIFTKEFFLFIIRAESDPRQWARRSGCIT